MFLPPLGGIVEKTSAVGTQRPCRWESRGQEGGAERFGSDFIRKIEFPNMISLNSFEQEGYGFRECVKKEN